MKTITPQDLAKRLEEFPKTELIDVRTPAEYREAHAVGAINEPLDLLDAKQLIKRRNGAGTLPLYVICASGTRAAAACKKLTAAGAENVHNVEGGTSAWLAADLPAVRGKKAMSLERQVRIAAGMMMLAGIGLSFVNLWLISISAAVGAGLIFAGITDWCGMGMLLAKMPWNRRVS